MQTNADESVPVNGAVPNGRHVVRPPAAADDVIPAVGPAGGGPVAIDPESVATLVRWFNLGAPPPAEAGTARGPLDLSFLAPARGPGELGRLGPYRVLEVLGRGGMGAVFLAEDPALGRRVALKVLPPGAEDAEASRRFLREARAAAAIEHDHIVPVYQVGEDRGVSYLAMQLLRGETLDERARREGRLPAAEVIRIGKEIATGLAAAHERGLIHRDIKPANVWLEADGGRVRILDFGLARPSDDVHLTEKGFVVGTPSYMAPEQAAGLPVDARADLFSLGCVLYHLAAGELPFPGTHLMATLTALAVREPPAPATLRTDLPPGLSNLIMRLLEKDPGRRPGSARAVAEALRRLEEDPSARADTPTELTPIARPVPPPAGRRRGRQAAALVLAAGLLAATTLTAYRAFVPPRGTLQLSVSPPGAAVTIDGEQPADVKRNADGNTLRIAVTPGRHVMRVEMDGFEPFEETFEARAGERVVISARLAVAGPAFADATRLTGPLLDAYRRLPDPAGTLGEPRGDLQGGHAGAVFIQFERGEIILPPGAPAARAIYGPIYEAYRALNGNAARVLGHPVGGIETGPGDVEQMRFERGVIVRPPRAQAAWVLHGAIYQEYLRLGDAAAALGRATGGVRDGWAGATYASFERAHIILPPDLPRAFTVRGGLFKAYTDLPDRGRVLGHPLGDDYPHEGGRRQDFERGHIVAPAEGAPHVVLD